MSMQYVRHFHGRTDAEIVGLALPKLEHFISNLPNGESEQICRAYAEGIPVCPRRQQK